MAGNWGIVNRDEVHRFIFALDQFQQGSLNEEEFTAQRLQHGIYGQRQDGQYMVRVKVPGGILDREQLDCIADLTGKYCNAEFANITTRQDIQLHFVELKHVPKVLLRLSDVGLTTREACGNTVRNITACSMAGVCPQEHVDVRPLLNKTTIHFLRHPLTQHLPRKVKMSFSGCEADCAMGLIHDLGVVAVKKDGVVGFKVLAGGGLGHKPREAIVLEEFIDEKHVIAVIESIITLHNRYSDRKKRAKSRLKFLVDRFGVENFKEKYKQIYQVTKIRLQQSEEKNEGVNNHPMRWCNIDVKARQADLNEGKSTVRLDIALGDIKPAQLKRISQVMREFNLKYIRTTQGQDLLLTDVTDKERKEIRGQLSGLMDETSFNPKALQSNVVACPGSWTCRLGITASRDMANTISKALSSEDGSGLKVNVSGCHNSCAQPQISDIGLHGEGRRKFGKLLPYYRFYFGGDGSMNGGFAVKGPEVPAVRVLSAIQKIERIYKSESVSELGFRHWVKTKNKTYFNELFAEFIEVNAQDVPVLLRENGNEVDFKVLQLGGGECAGIAEETVSAYLSEVNYERNFVNVFFRQNELESTLDCAENIMSLLLKSLLFKKGETFSPEDSDGLRKIEKHFSNHRNLVSGYYELCNKLRLLKIDNSKIGVELFLQDLDQWREIVLVEIELPLVTKNHNKDVIEMLDLRKESPPMQYLKAKHRFSLLENGKSLKIIFQSDSDANLVFKGLASNGLQFLSMIDDKKGQQTLLHMLKPNNHSPLLDDVKKENHAIV